jgi:hypothetical protein
LPCTPACHAPGRLFVCCDLLLRLGHDARPVGRHGKGRLGRDLGARGLEPFFIERAVDHHPGQRGGRCGGHAADQRRFLKRHVPRLCVDEAVVEERVQRLVRDAAVAELHEFLGVVREFGRIVGGGDGRRGLLEPFDGVVDFFLGDQALHAHPGQRVRGAGNRRERGRLGMGEHGVVLCVGDQAVGEKGEERIRIRSCRIHAAILPWRVRQQKRPRRAPEPLRSGDHRAGQGRAIFQLPPTPSPVLSPAFTSLAQ